jgi:hypothetical protein
MNSKDKLLSSIHKMFRKDPYIVSLLNAAGIELDKVANKTIQIKEEFLFSTMSLEQVARLENLLDFKTTSASLEGKRLEIEARWKSSGKCDLELLQTIAEAWKADTVKLSFKKGVIIVDFLGGMNIDYDMTGLRNALNEAKPAHLPLLLTATEQYQTTTYFGGFLQENEKIDLTNMETNDSMIENTIIYAGAVMGVNEFYEL